LHSILFERSRWFLFCYDAILFVGDLVSKRFYEMCNQIDILCISKSHTCKEIGRLVIVSCTHSYCTDSSLINKKMSFFHLLWNIYIILYKLVHNCWDLTFQDQCLCYKVSYYFSLINQSIICHLNLISSISIADRASLQINTLTFHGTSFFG
jgi:hypothetical protein